MTLSNDGFKTKSCEEVVESYKQVYLNFKSIYLKFKMLKQRNMPIPTDPEEIHRRAREIRKRLKVEKTIAKDLDLIKYDLRFKPEKKQRRTLLSILIEKIREKKNENN